MANLIVRNIDDEIVKSLKARAGLHGVSAEAEHRKILEEALRRPQKRSLVELLMAIPSVGEDSDFERKQDDEGTDVFA
jgi:plasmid stability protein